MWLIRMGSAEDLGNLRDRIQGNRRSGWRFRVDIMQIVGPDLVLRGSTLHK